MIYSINCTAKVNAQNPDAPTYKKIDCTAQIVNEYWPYGEIINCTATITNIIVAACKSLDQGIRLVVTIDDIDVSEALIGNIDIQHNKNMISTFLLNLSDTQCSPRINSHIGLDKVVVIMAYINGQEKKLFTGSTDEPEAEDTPNFKVIVPGRDYGKKLLDKTTTIVDVQDLADSKKRNDLIKYLAEQAGGAISDIPEMGEVTISNSFQDQSIWDMIQKEAMVELYWVSHNEDGKLELKLDEIKSDEELYPTPDWIYDEDKITRINYKKTRVGVNRITVLGTTTQYRIPNYSENYNVSVNDSHTWSPGEGPATYNANISGFIITCQQRGAGLAYLDYYIKLSYSGSFQYLAGNATVTGDGQFRGISYRPDLQAVYIHFWRYKPESSTTVTINYFIQGYKKDVTYETRYDQISAKVTDPNSIAKYGERDGGSVEYPFLETVEQCIAVGKNIIKFNHKLGITSFEIPFNSLAKTGHTVAIINKKIGLNEIYLADGIGHRINIDDEGKIKARTEVEGIHYV